MAAITRTVRGLVCELELTATDVGVPTDCIVNFDNIHIIPREAFRRHVVTLEPPRLAQVCQRQRGIECHYRVSPTGTYLKRGLGCHRCSRRGLWVSLRTRYLQGVHDVIDVAATRSVEESSSATRSPSMELSRDDPAPFAAPHSRDGDGDGEALACFALVGAGHPDVTSR